ncbi:MAG: NAD-glutamate dehydrogenase, partial [Vicinamibacteria bacterium]|nr:NAD-glutamate dehydrogenase [Vicinamibacteria bacterium]
MLTHDPQGRAARLTELKAALRHETPPEDSELIAAFAEVIFNEWSDRIALDLPIESLVARVRSHFHFVAREVPPPTQLYKGLPGLHVSARNPGQDEALALRAQSGRPLEITVIETHTADAPFILESLKNYCRKAGLRVYSALGAVFTVKRLWERISWIGGAFSEGALEAYCRLEIEHVESKERLRRLEHEIFSVLKCVTTAVEDFDDMTRVTRALWPRLRSRRGDLDDVDAARDFLQWLLNDNYVFLGTVSYRIEAGAPVRVAESATGVFKDSALLPVVFPGLIEEVESSLVPEDTYHRIIDIDYCHNAQAIYHLEPIDDIVVREWDADGRLILATLLLGRLSLGAFAQRAGDIPLLKEKQDWLLAASGDVTNSHFYREIRALFNRFPKRELFYADRQALKEIFDRIIYTITSDDEIAVHCRSGAGYLALYAAFSRVRYSYRVEEELRRALARSFGPISFMSSADCGSVMALVFYFDTSRLDHPVEVARVEKVLAELVTTWEDRVMTELIGTFGEQAGSALWRRYRGTLGGLYREVTPPEEVADDIRELEALEGRLSVRVIPRAVDAAALKVYAPHPLPLSSSVRTLENLGLSVTEELRVPLQLPEGRKCLLYRFDVEARPERIAALGLPSGLGRFRAALQAVDELRASDCPLNALVLQAGLGWREVAVLRALRNYLLQIRSQYNVDTINGVLLRNANVTAALYQDWAARFDPAIGDDRAAIMAEREQSVQRALEGVKNLLDDEVLRVIDNLIGATIRTNVFEQPERPVIAIKIESARVVVMPSPRPLYEITVHSPLIEGIHLRGGRVARGGIRWSDRHDDFRTEILGLMKTQMVKNAIIVPVGSKGGFVLKGHIPPRPALDAYLTARYREFIAGLLDVTDNIVDGRIVHPPQVVHHDGDDPYLVVAADKGTAHLSDTANSVSNQYGFWLGDAFASGGEYGYDHKKIGITARGAWKCVEHHFRNLGHDVATQPFTCCGIGDLSGDVFGNGALLSRAMKLVAAFNHVHVFIDPQPDPAISYEERERLFRLPRSTWRDYNPELISRGGGVFDRAAKAIPISPEMSALLDLHGPTATGEEVIRHVLKARVDLLYNGGIGTYVKASGEEDAIVGDRANDRVRVLGGEVRARVVAEGGNLGITQRGRIECDARGALINTDAIDNSGGVDMSDHEVNLKILLDDLLKQGVLKSREERNALLTEMTAEVAELVLADNARQALALTLDRRRSARHYQEYVELIEQLVSSGVLNAQDDAIPGREEL